MSRSSELFASACAEFDAARAQSRVELAAAEARVAQLKHAAELEKQGRYEEAREVLAAVERDRERWS